MNLSNLEKIKGNKRKAKRLGRGYGSAVGGHTVGRGTKGQKARGKPWAGFEGGQIPLYKRLPQIGGFRNPTSKNVRGINLTKLNVFKTGNTISPADFVRVGILKNTNKLIVKILGGGDLTVKLKLKGFIYSESAREKIKKSGSTIIE